MGERTGWAELLTGGRLALLALIWLGVWLTASDSLVTATILPSVGAELGGYAWFAWTVAGFMLGAILSGACAGMLAARFGLRAATTLGGLVFTLGCALSAVATSMPLFVLGRVLQGVGGGWVQGLAMVAIAHLFPAHHIARIFASVAAVWGVATVLGPLIGGLFSEGSGWRTVFWLFGAQGLVFTLAAPALLDAGPVDDREDGHAVPWAQLALLALGILALGSAEVFGGGFAALLALLVGLPVLAFTWRLDVGARAHVLPRAAGDLLSPVGSAYAAMFALTAAAMGLTVYGPAILQTLGGLSPLAAGYVVATEAAAWTLAAFAVAGVEGPGERRAIRAGAVLVLLGCLVLAVVMHEAKTLPAVFGAGLMGTGFGLSMALMNRRLLAALPASEKTIGSAALIFVRQTGNAVGAAVAGLAANAAGLDRGLSRESAAAAGVAVFVAALPLAVLGTMAAFRMTGRGTQGPATAGAGS